VKVKTNGKAKLTPEQKAEKPAIKERKAAGTNALIDFARQYVDHGRYGWYLTERGTALVATGCCPHVLLLGDLAAEIGIPSALREIAYLLEESPTEADHEAAVALVKADLTKRGLEVRDAAPEKAEAE
jgi:hypothetical protein